MFCLWVVGVGGVCRGLTPPPHTVGWSGSWVGLPERRSGVPRPPGASLPPGLGPREESARAAYKVVRAHC